MHRAQPAGKSPRMLTSTGTGRACPTSLPGRSGDPVDARRTASVLQGLGPNGIAAAPPSARYAAEVIIGALLVVMAIVLVWRLLSLVGGLHWIVTHGARYADAVEDAGMDSRTGRRRRWEIAQEYGGGRHWLLRPFGIRSLWLEYWSYSQSLSGHRLRGLLGRAARLSWKWNWFAPAVATAVVAVALCSKSASDWPRWPMLAIAIGLLIGSLIIAAEAVTSFRRMGSWGAVYHDRTNRSVRLEQDLSELKVTAGAVLVAWSTIWPAVSVAAAGFGAFSPGLSERFVPGFLQVVANSLPGLGGTWAIAEPVGAGLAVLSYVVYTVYLVVIVQFFVSSAGARRP